jgi:hypothetical protein
MAGGIKINVGAQLDTSAVKQKVTELATSLGVLDKAKFNPIDKATIADLTAVEKKFQELLKLQKELARRVKETGQQGIGFSGMDWAKIYPNPATRARQMRMGLNYVTQGTGMQGIVPPVAPGAPPSPGTPPRMRPSPGVGFGAAMGGIGMRGLRAGLGAAGGMGGAINQGIGAGMEGGMGAGLAGGVGAMLALGVGKLVGAIKDKIDDAGRDAVAYDTLKRTLGDVNVSFTGLRNTLQASAKELDITFAESAKLGLQFSKLSGLAYGQEKSLTSEVYTGGGFGRSFGLDPSQGVGFMASMRQSKVTIDDNDSKRLALQVGDAIVKTGSSAKADEVLQAISSYTTQQTRLGLVSANVPGYSGMLSAMAGSKIPGLDVAGSANILNRVNGAIQSGGNGEAGQNFMYSAIGKNIGLNPIQTQILQEQGAFGTGAGTFGKGSLYSRYTAKFGGGGNTGAAAQSTQTSLSATMSKLEQMYAGRSDLMLDAMSSQFGVSHSQAMALSLTNPSDLNGIQDRLKRTGVDLKNVDSTSIESLARINNGDRETLGGQAESLFNRTGKDALSDDDRSRLRGALQSGNDEQVKDVLTELTATRSQESTEGDKTRHAIIALQNTTEEAAAKMLPVMNAMREGILYMAGDHGKMGPMGIHLAMQRAETDEHIRSVQANGESIKAKRAALVNSLKSSNSNLTPRENQAITKKNMEDHKSELDGLTAQYQREVNDKVDGLNKAYGDDSDAYQKNYYKDDAKYQADPGGAQGADNAALDAYRHGGGKRSNKPTPQMLAYMSQTDKLAGLPPGTTAGLTEQESGFNPDAVSKAGAIGLGQIMPQNIANLSRKAGRKLDPTNIQDSMYMERMMLMDAMRQEHNVTRALKNYNGGPESGRWNSAENKAYPRAVLSRARKYADATGDSGSPSTGLGSGMYSTDMPDGFSTSMAAPATRVSIDGTFNLNGPNGQPAASPVAIKKQVGVAQPAGL